MKKRLQKIWIGVLGAAAGSGIALGILLFVLMSPTGEAASSRSGAAASNEGSTQTASVDKQAEAAAQEGGAADAGQTQNTDGSGSADQAQNTLQAETGQGQSGQSAQAETAAQNTQPETAAQPAQTEQQKPEVSIEETPATAAPQQPAGDSTFYKDGTVVGPNDYIMPAASERTLSESDIARLTLKGICYLKNELYAKHGRKFTTRQLQEYFSSKPWYQGIYEPVQDDSTVVGLMNAAERANIELLDAAEARQGYYQFS